MKQAFMQPIAIEGMPTLMVFGSALHHNHGVYQTVRIGDTYTKNDGRHEATEHTVVAIVRDIQSKYNYASIVPSADPRVCLATNANLWRHNSYAHYRHKPVEAAKQALVLTLAYVKMLEAEAGTKAEARGDRGRGVLPRALMNLLPHNGMKTGISAGRFTLRCYFYC